MKRKSYETRAINTKLPMKMILANRPELIGELKHLVASAKQEKSPININMPGAKDSAFYKEVQNVRELDASLLEVTQITVQFIAEIAATSPMLQVVGISHNNLGQRGPTVAAIFSESDSIRKVDISYNNLGKDRLATMIEFEKRNKYINTVDMLLHTIVSLSNPLIKIVVGYVGHHIEFDIIEDIW
jgi:hypothetical protein